MNIYKKFKRTYKSYQEYKNDAEKYFEELNFFLDNNPNHNLEFSKCQKHKLYTGYRSPEHIIELIQNGTIKVDKKEQSYDETPIFKETRGSGFLKYRTSQKLNDGSRLYEVIINNEIIGYIENTSVTSKLLDLISEKLNQ